MVIAGKSEPYEEKRLKEATQGLKENLVKHGIAEEEADEMASQAASQIIEATTAHYSSIIPKNRSPKNTIKRLL